MRWEDIPIEVIGYDLLLDEYYKNVDKNPACKLTDYWSSRRNREIYEGIRKTKRLVQGYVGNGWPEVKDQSYALGLDKRNLASAFDFCDCRDVGDAIYQANLLLDYIDKDEKLWIMDIGAGYGRLAIPFIFYKNKRDNEHITELTYVGVDSVPISLLVAPQFVERALDLNISCIKWNNFYLNDFSTAHFVSLPTWRIELVESRKFDLFVSVHSFQEMEDDTINFYLDFAQKHSHDKSYLYSVNLMDYSKFEHFDRWENILHRPYPINRDGNFNETLWRIT